MDMSFSEFLVLEVNEYPNLKFGVEIEIPIANWTENLIKPILKQMGLGWSYGVDMTCVPGIEIKCKPQYITNSALQTLEADLQLFKNGAEKAGLQIGKNPGRCATHIHIGGLNQDTKIKVAKLWIDGGIQDMETSLINPERKKLMDTPGSYMRRVKSIDQYQTLPHSVASTKVGKFIQDTISFLKNTLAFDKYAGYDKFYSLSPRGGLGTLEFRTKESTVDGHEIAVLIRSIGALCSAASYLYDKLRSGEFDSSTVRQTLYKGGVGARDLSYVMRRASS
jgi:hypothetical protein